MRKSITAVAALLLLSACSAQPAPSEPASEPPAASQPTQEVAAEPVPGFDQPAEFGEAVTFPAGFDVTVTAGGSRPVTEDDGVVFNPGDVIVSYTVEVVNNSAERLEADSLSPSIGGDDVYAFSNGDLGAVFPGDTAEGVFEQMMPGADVEDVRITVQDPTHMGPEAIFEGSLK